MYFPYRPNPAGLFTNLLKNATSACPHALAWAVLLATASQPGVLREGAALGCGQQKGYHETYRGVDIEVNLLKKVRLEIAVNDHFVQPTIDAIIKGARTNRIGDGKVFVLPLERCVRIRTGEEGNEAIG